MLETNPIKMKTSVDACDNHVQPQSTISNSHFHSKVNGTPESNCVATGERAICMEQTPNQKQFYHS
jgi:hypothetical protein